MALPLTQTLVAHGTYSVHEARRGYVHWFESDPFQVDFAVMSGLAGLRSTAAKPASQENTAGRLWNFSKTHIKLRCVYEATDRDQ